MEGKVGADLSGNEEESILELNEIRERFVRETEELAGDFPEKENSKRILRISL